MRRPILWGSMLALSGWVGGMLAGPVGAAVPPLSTVMVPMRDGVRLATDVYLPEGPGPWPVALARTPYDKRNIEATGVRISGLRQSGIAVVAQDARLPVEERVDPADEPLAVQHRHDEVAVPAFRPGHVDLEPEAEAEKLLGARAIRDQLVERGKKRRPRPERLIEQLGMGEPLALEAFDSDGHCHSFADEGSKCTFPLRWPPVEDESELLDTRDSGSAQLPLEHPARHLSGR